MPEISQPPRSARIDPTALVSPLAKLGEGVEIGPFCRVGPDAVLGARVVLVSHVVIEGHTSIGEDTVVHPFTLLGGPPQHRRYAGEPTRLEIGARCEIREQVSIHRGTAHSGGLTRVGDNALLMAQTHVGHDCMIGDNVTMAGNATLAGHCVIGDGAVIGGVSALHQHVRIGRGAIVGGCAAVPMDVIPFGSAFGNHARLRGLNLIGLKRAGLPRATIHRLRGLYHALFVAEGPPFRSRIEPLAHAHADCPQAMEVIDFIRAAAGRPILPALRREAGDEGE